MCPRRMVRRLNEFFEIFARQGYEDSRFLLLVPLRKGTDSVVLFLNCSFVPGCSFLLSHRFHLGYSFFSLMVLLGRRVGFDHEGVSVGEGVGLLMDDGKVEIT